MSLVTTFTVTLLGLASGGAAAALRLSSLMTMMREVGATIQVVTQPAQLAFLEPLGAQIVLIDGLRSAEFDVPYLIGLLRAHRCMGIIVLVENHAQRLQAVGAGADLGWICPPNRRGCVPMFRRWLRIMGRLPGVPPMVRRPCPLALHRRRAPNTTWSI